MSRKEKLLIRLLQKPNDFTYNELETLLSGFGYIEMKTGKTSGSRVAFFNEQTTHVIRLHKPHPSNILKSYQVLQIIEVFKKIGIIQ